MCQNAKHIPHDGDEYQETGSAGWTAPNVVYWHLILDVSCMIDGENWGQYMSRVEALLQASRSDCVVGVTSGRYVENLSELQTIGPKLELPGDSLRIPEGDSGHYFTVAIA